MDLNNASAIVTGGASGIGAAVARQLSDKGATVVVADLNAEKGEALAKEIGGVFVEVDVTNTEQIINAVDTAAKLGPLRALVNSAGVGRKSSLPVLRRTPLAMFSVNHGSGLPSRSTSLTWKSTTTRLP